ncbi:MAG TPA: zinc-ribbon domain-containing protein [Clostridiaceae bacterium]|nr:zinc-ribbon domain-containing protein [Clostridiaceae bacterium]
MYCHNCGTSLPSETEFCPFCGTNLKNEQSNTIPEKNTITSAHVPNSFTPNTPSVLGRTETTDMETEQIFPAEMSRVEASPVRAYGAPPYEMRNEQAPRYGIDPKSPAPKKKKSKKVKLFLTAGIVLVVVVAGVLITFFMINKKKQARYDEGTALLESGDYEQAQKIFLELENFSDSSDKANDAQKGLDYESAVKKMEKGQFDKAKSAFEELGDYKDSVKLAAKCQHAMDYESAKALYEAGNYKEAEPLFKSAKDYLDAEKLAAECRKAMDYESAKALYEAGNYAEAEALFKNAADYLDAKELAAQCNAKVNYDKAKSLMEAGDYVSAKELLAKLDSTIIPDKDALIKECDNMPKYLDAKKLLEEGKNYDAYKIFKGLGSFLDSSKLASDCTIPMPKTGVTYRNKDYSGTRCSLVIKPPTSDGSTTYIKLYAENGAHVASIFINAGGKAKIKLPPGKYRIKAAYSFGSWFGEKDMFGDEGFYQVLKMSATSDLFQFKANYEYTLSLRTSKAGNVTTNKENRKDF